MPTPNIPGKGLIKGLGVTLNTLAQTWTKVQALATRFGLERATLETEQVSARRD